MMGRREFMKRSAVASTLVSAGLATRAADALASIRCGILGLGHSHALDLLEQVRKSPDFDLVGVCEPDDAVLAQWKDKPELSGVRWLTRDELLGDDSIKMVAIESAVPRLLQLGRAAVEAGKHVHLDKPAGTSLPEFRALLDEARKRALIVQMGYMFRYNPGFDFVRRAVAEDWLGGVYAVHGSICTDLTPEKRQRMAFHPGGLMLELGCHLLDMLVLILGVPAKATPFLRHDGGTPDGLADNTLAVLQYDHAMATVRSAAMEPEAFPERTFEVCGTQGAVTLRPLEPPAIRLSLRRPAGGFKAGEQMIKVEDIDRHVRDLADLARSIRGEAKFAYTYEHDFNVQKTLLRACGVDT